MKRTSLRWKTANVLFLMVTLAFVLGIVLCVIFSSRYFVSLKQRSMQDLYAALNEGEAGAANEERVYALCEEEGMTLLVKNVSGEPVYAFGPSATLSQRLDDITFARDESGEEGSRVVTENPDYTLQIVSNSEAGEPSYIEMYGFLDDGNSFVARSSLGMIQNNIRVSLTFFAIVCAAILVISAIVIYFIIGYYSKPITRLSVLAQKINEGEFDSAELSKPYQYKHLRQDEIGILGDNIREISEKLESNIAELKTSNLNLENDLKKMTELEEARKKYMSDVSHELKTPIALIAGYAEGLKEGISSSQEDRDYYCDVIIDEAEKMNVIIKRLSTLNQLEEGKSAVSLERFNVVEVINGFLNTMSVIIEDRGAKIFFDAKRHAYVWSDEFLFEEVLVNYFNNALNHMNEEKIIRINVERIGENIRVTVFNSGDPIPEEELDQIWIQFYKVDKARTREYGGSGLGLSIVKAVADSLNKECGVYNLPDGVAFWIDLEAASFTEEEEKTEEEEHAPRLKLSELPIWKQTATTASRLLSSTTRNKDKQNTEEKKKAKKEKPEKEKPKKEKSDKEKPKKEKSEKPKKEKPEKPKKEKTERSGKEKAKKDTGKKKGTEKTEKAPEGSEDGQKEGQDASDQ